MADQIVQAAIRGIAPEAVIPEEKKPIGKDQVRKALETLKKYKNGKTHLEDKVVKNEKWFKKRHWDLMGEKGMEGDPKPSSGWLFNTIISKHADFMDSFPQADILPREEGDEQEARILSSIIPVILEQNDYEATYSDETWYKIKHGTGIFGVFWDQSKLNGLGDISIKSVDLLQLFWEPGVTDIQQSKNVFSVELVDNDIIEEKYPQTRGLLKDTEDKTVLKKYWFDDTVETAGKSAVIDWYYHKTIKGKRTLQYCKFVGDIVLYATENETKPPTETVEVPQTDEAGNPLVDEYGQQVSAITEVPVGRSTAERGWYDHGMYPFVFDALFKEAGMPVGFGMVDVCKSPQTTIDILNNALEKSAIYGANPRYFARNDGGINEEEFADPHQLLVHVDGNLADDSYKRIEPPDMNGNIMEFLNMKVDEMKETAGNRDTSNGGSTAGVTAASAIAAMQEQSGKTSRDMIKTTYRAHKKVINFVIELIRQFYDMPRTFRIIGEQGEQEYISYSNAGLKPQNQGVEFGVDMGYRLPVFDIKVETEKQSAYSQMSQNEMALQFFNLGFFNPQYSDQVLACMDMMEFNNKSKIARKIEENGTMYQQIAQMQQQMLQMAQMIDQLTGGESGLTEGVASGILQEGEPETPTGRVAPKLETESSVTRNARKTAAATTEPR